MVALFAVALSACSGTTTSTPRADRADEGGTSRRFAAALEGLCAARRQAVSDAAGAKTTFFDRSHDALHEMARDLEDVDRAVAAVLLTAKQRVEADLSATPVSPDLAGDLGRLVDATGTALDRLGVDTKGCRP